MRSLEPMKDIRRESSGARARAPGRHKARRGQGNGIVSASQVSAPMQPRGAPFSPGPAAARGLRGADQAQGPVAASADDDHDDVRRRDALAPARCAHLPRRIPLSRRRGRDQPLLGPRHRRADGADRGPAGARRSRLAGRRAQLRDRARLASVLLFGYAINWLAAGLSFAASQATSASTRSGSSAARRRTS